MSSRLVRHVTYPLHERLLKRPTFQYLSELEKSQWYSRDEVEQLQMDKLRTLLMVAIRNCPWHAERINAAGLGELLHNPLLTREHLHQLPTMTKSDARQNRDAMLWRDAPGGIYQYNTGGSSGEPLVFYYGRRRQASDAAGRMRARRWWGIDVGDKEVYLWGAPVELAKTDRIRTIRDRLFNQLVLNAFQMSTTDMDAYIEAINLFKPKCVYGYASSIVLLASYARDTGKNLEIPSLKVVCTTGEPLYPEQRTIIEEVFGVPVANEFGSRDIGFTAHETPAGQMLLISESIILEVLDNDGRPVPKGQVGEAVMTGLCSETQPFIRYRTGDMLRVKDDLCVSSRGLHVVDEISGRTTDFVVSADGTVMHALAVIYVIRELEGIEEFKLIQHSVNEVEILVVPGDTWDEGVSNKIKHGLRARLGSDVQVQINLVDAIAAEASGKYRNVVSNVPLPHHLDISVPASAIQ